ncbi:hypothetical protein ACLBYN_49580, partial [Pseudomonas aeruginosa]
MLDGACFTALSRCSPRSARRPRSPLPSPKPTFRGNRSPPMAQELCAICHERPAVARVSLVQNGQRRELA